VRTILLLALALLALVACNVAHAQEMAPGASCVWTHDGSPDTCPNTYPSASAAQTACVGQFNYFTGLGGQGDYNSAGGGACAEFASNIGKCYYLAVINIPPSAYTKRGYYCGDPTNDQQACQALHDAGNDPSSSGFIKPSDYMVTNFDHKCVGGCNFALRPGSVTVGAPGGNIYGGQYEFTGATCTATVDSPPPAARPVAPTSQVCKPAGDGQTFCVQQDGQECYTISPGRQTCWQRTETGTKTDGPYAQVRGPGSTTPPAPPPPNGETFNQSGTPVTISSTSNNVTTTTTVINYITNNGTSAGPTDQGEPSDGSGHTSSASGGSCDSGYSCSGDAIQCAQLAEEHKARCALEESPSISGGSTCGAGDTPLCTGSGCNALQYAGVIQAWKTRCQAEALKGSIDSIKDGIGTTGTSDGTTGSNAGDVAIWHSQDGDGLLGLINTQGFLGSHTCPPLPDWNLGAWGTFAIDSTNWCKLVDAVGAMVLLIGAILALWILLD
jgi:hypothetical protein